MEKLSQSSFKVILFSIVLLTIFLHLLTITFPHVNMEFAFASASQYFESGVPRDLDIFFSYQANTLGMPYLSFVINKLLPFIDISNSPKLISILGILLLLYAIILLGRKLNLTNTCILLLITIILLNPIVWVYSQRGTADFIPMAVGMLGFTFFITRPFSSAVYLSILLLNIAVILKYHALIFVMASVIYLVLNKEQSDPQKYLTAFYVMLSSLIFPILYVLYIKHQFNFWFTPPKFMSLHQITLTNSLTNLFSYATYLFLLSLPFSILVLLRGFKQTTNKQRKLLALVTSAVMMISLLIPFAAGEMNFGPLDRFITPTYFKMISGIGAAAFVLTMYFLANKSNDKNKIITFISLIVIFLFLLSLSRPAQRYLLLILPILYILIFLSFNNRPPRFLTALTIVIFIVLNIYTTAHQYSAGTAALEISQELKSKNLLMQTNPGAIESHTGQMFYGIDRDTAKYTIIPGIHRKAVITIGKDFYGLVHRSYSVVEN